MWSVNLFFLLLGVGHRLDVDEEGRPSYVLGFLPVWAGFVLLAAVVVVLLAHVLVPVLEPAELNVTQSFRLGRTGGNVTIAARWVRPWGGGFDWGMLVSTPAYIFAVGVGAPAFYWLGWHLADRVEEWLPEPPRFHLDASVLLPQRRRRENISRVARPVSAAHVLGLEVRGETDE